MKYRNNESESRNDPTDPYTDGALDALKRAAVNARRRNIALLGSVVTWRDGKIVYDTEP